VHASGLFFLGRTVRRICELLKLSKSTTKVKLAVGSLVLPLSYCEGEY
jgi:hypothetical protein